MVCNCHEKFIAFLGKTFPRNMMHLSISVLKTEKRKFQIDFVGGVKLNTIETYFLKISINTSILS